MLPFKVSFGTVFRFDGWAYKALTDFMMSIPRGGPPKFTAKGLQIAAGDVLYVNEGSGAFTYEGTSYAAPRAKWLKAAVRDKLLVKMLSADYLLGRVHHTKRVNFDGPSRPARVPGPTPVRFEDLFPHEPGKRPDQKDQKPRNPEQEFDAEIRDGLCDLDGTDPDLYDIDRKPVEGPPASLTPDERSVIDNPEFWTTAVEEMYVPLREDSPKKPKIVDWEAAQVQMETELGKSGAQDVENGSNLAP